MTYEVATNLDSERDTLGPFHSLAEAKETVTRLACEIIGRQRFDAYVIPVPDETEGSPGGRQR
jgi:hypothetical protein